MLSPLINGKTVNLTKIVNFVLCVCMCTHTSRSSWRVEETIRSPEAGVTAK